MKRPPANLRSLPATVSAVRGADGKVLLDADALARTLSRIAHEIIEANPDLDRSRSSASTRAASRSRSACAA